MKKIIHFQIPFDEKGLLLDVNTVSIFMNKVKEIVGNDYYIIITPLTPVNSDCIYNIPLNSLKDMPVNDWDEFIYSEIDKLENE